VTDDLQPPPALRTALERGREAGADSGGDPACWLDRVCDACGRLVEGPDEVCPACGAPLGTSGA
jgi:rubrerythrin